MIIEKVGIVGMGHVGSLMNLLFKDAVVYDELKNIGSMDEINKCKITFVCVPTPKCADGSCDVSIVENVLNWINSDIIVLRSTVPVGFTEAQKSKLNKKIIFQPEYYGETKAHPFQNPNNRDWITLGGATQDVNEVVKLYQKVYNSNIFINVVDSKTAELAKYMENSYLAMKVTFCNQFYDLAKIMGVDYNQLRETWLLDPRIGRSHTFVFEDDRGYGGSCLPKDVASIINQANNENVNFDLLKSVEKINGKLYKN